MKKYFAVAVAMFTVATAQAGATPQTITFALPAAVTVGTTFNASATASSGLTVFFSSQTPAVCTVAGNMVTTLTVGNCTIAADQAGNAFYLAAPQVVRSFAVTGNAQSISFAAPPSTSLSVGSVALSATASSSLPVSFSSQTLPVCTVAGSTATLLAVGTCAITASQSGNATFAAAANVTQSFAVTASSGGGTGDVPLPAWALWLLAGGLIEVARRRKAA